jgi:hypothetical protein
MTELLQYAQEFRLMPVLTNSPTCCSLYTLVIREITVRLCRKLHKFFLFFGVVFILSYKRFIVKNGIHIQYFHLAILSCLINKKLNTPVQENGI